MYEDVGEGQGEEANIAFFIQISPTNVILVPRLLSRIWHPDNIYCLHIDEKLENDALVDFKEALASNSKLSNVFLLPSTSITYAGVSMLVNTLDGMHSLLQSKSLWDYFINLSGSDYPLISITAMRRLLGMPSVKNHSTNFVHYSTNVASWEEIARHRLGILHFDFSLGFRSNHTIQLAESRMRHPVLSSGNLKVIVAKGESWIMVHRLFCEYAAHGNVARRLLALFANMQSPSEHFFQTLGWNHLQLNKTLATHSFRDVVWKHGGIRSIQHPYIVDKREPNGFWPFWDDIALSPNFFSRKFSIPDSPMLDQIDLLKSGATEKAANLTAVYQSFAIVKNRFACVTEHARSRKHPHIMPCFFSGWMQRGCRGGQTELCASDVPPPASKTKIFSTPWKK
ncbi:Xylosyltransferase, family GT14 [Chondrus crispus]|uniref:protein xylosyltransferase n=1 Tax=Chondrus crispus TaxID=2769 RepID=R7QH59_CHOCR|nr:Xylosyltransferase, family GT14 [Chondrus crispus]CDF37404.1 Xylosyltransferase, family GT14 [Chondrus crispus]|eukprot:XP_005717223.1 Xylosyltransferase, family GT14 [Chondrus crispus]